MINRCRLNGAFSELGDASNSASNKAKLIQLYWALNKALLAISALAYPFCVAFAAEFYFYAACALAFCWLQEFARARDLSALLIAALFAACAWQDASSEQSANFSAEYLKFIYPVLMNAIFARGFFASLKTTPIITKIALLQKPNLPTEGLLYTRRLTIIWAWFFVANGLIAALLALLFNKYLWAIYTGCIAYLLTAALFFGEILFRKVVLKV